MYWPISALTDTWLDEWAAEGLAEIEAFLAKHNEFWFYCVERDYFLKAREA